MRIFQAFGLDIKLLIANFVNFLILVFVLYKLGYKPILKFVKERQEKIEKGIKDAEDATKKLENAEVEKDELLSAAHKEAQEIIKNAKEQATLQSDAITKKAKSETASIVEKAKKEIRLEKEQSIVAARKEIAQIAILATEKLLNKKMDKKESERIAKEGLGAINE